MGNSADYAELPIIIFILKDWKLVKLDFRQLNS